MDNQEIRDTLRKKAGDIPVPDSLQPDQIEEKVKNRTQNQPRFKASRRSILTAAAVFVVLCIVGLVPMFSYLSRVDELNGPIIEETIIADREEKSGVTYDEIYDAISGYHKEQDENTRKSYDGLNFMEDAASESEQSTGSAPTKKAAESSSDDTAAGTADHSETDTQVNGVMEGDVVKTDGKHIFTVKEDVFGSSVTIYKAEGADVEELSKIQLSQADCSELYIEGNTLIAIGNLWEEDGDSNSIAEDRLWEDNELVEPLSQNYTQSHITLYDISDPTAPEQLRQLKQSGGFNTSRISDGFVYTFTNYAVNSLEYKKNQPEDYIPEINGNMMSADRIRLSEKKGGDSYMVMTSLKLSDHADFADSQAVLGNFNTYYMNQEHIYAVKPDNWWEGSGKSSIVKYSYDNGKFSFCGSTKIRGEINNSYYMHEYKGNFVFVYTRLKRNQTTNGLCVLGQDLKLIGEISDLGVDETIYSSYFIDNMAYFVTFRNTDPVFAVDISNPKKPELKSELKLPGFSSYLHSFGTDKLIGIGSSSGVNDRVKLSLFSIGKDYEIREIDKKLEKRGSESSESYADENHKCVFVDEERGLIGLAIETWNYDDDDEDVSNRRTYYIVYRHNKGKLKKVLDTRLSNDSSLQNVRGLRIGEYFYIVDADKKGGIEVYDINTWKKAK